MTGRLAIAWMTRMYGATNDKRRMNVYHIVRTHLSHLLPVSCLPYHVDLLLPIRRKPLSDFARPPPASSLLSSCLIYSPAPRSGDEPADINSHGAGYDAIRLLLIVSPRSLTAFVRYRHDVCLLTGRTTERRTKRENRTRNGTTGGTMNGTEEWNARMYKKAGGTPSSDFPARLLCLVLRPCSGYRAAFPYFPFS